MSAEIEDAIDNGDLALVSQKLSSIQNSLKILSHVQDYEDRVIFDFLFVVYFDKVESDKKKQLKIIKKVLFHHSLERLR